MSTMGDFPAPRLGYCCPCCTVIGPKQAPKPLGFTKGELDQLAASFKELAERRAR